MITTLIIAGLLGMIAPWLGFVALFIGGMFVASTAAGLAAIAIVVGIVCLIYAYYK